MSVIRYDMLQMIDCLAACWAYGSIGSNDAKRKLDWMAEAGNRILKANGDCYAHTYREEVDTEPTITGDHIKRACIQKTVDTQQKGYRVLDGLRYNLVANDGMDFATPEILDDLLALTRNALDLSRLRGGR